MKLLLAKIFLVGGAFLAMLHLALGVQTFGMVPWLIGDEWGYQVTLSSMLTGILNGSLQEMFSFGFYSYGFGFFAIPMIVTAPFQLMGWDAMTLLIPRVMTIGICIAVLSQLARRHWFWPLALLTMPSIWDLAVQFKPEWWMVGGLVISVTYLSKQDTFWKGAWLFSLTVALTKIQAITWSIFPISLILLPLFHDRSRKMLRAQGQKLMTFLGMLLGVFVVCNPYILHPLGFRAFWRRLVENMVSNATNHGIVGQLSAWEKIEQVLSAQYLSLALFIFFVMMLSAVGILSIKKTPSRTLLVGAVGLNLVYLLVMVNKAWPQYYLSVVVVGIWVLADFFKAETLATKRHILVVLLCLNTAGHVGPFVTLYETYRSPAITESLQARSQIITRELEPYVGPDTHLLITYPFSWDYRAMGLGHNQLHTIVGPLSDKYLHLTGYRQYWFDQGIPSPKPFVDKSIVILDKRSVYFDEVALSKQLDQDAYQNSLELIKQLRAGAWGYQVLYEDETVLIFIQPVSLDRVASLSVY